jgi:hypothetical protein
LSSERRDNHHEERRSGQPDHRKPDLPGQARSGRKNRSRSQREKRGHSPGPIRLIRIAGNDYELVHPRQVMEVDLDFQEGLEIWKAGDPEGARDALRHALSACHENLWVHVALGQIALQEFRDPNLARGHFGFAVELAKRALQPGFTGRLPRDRSNNQPFYEALAGLIRCLEVLGQAKDAGRLRALGDRLSEGCGRETPAS